MIPVFFSPMKEHLYSVPFSHAQIDCIVSREVSSYDRFSVHIRTGECEKDKWLTVTSRSALTIPKVTLF